MFLFNGAYVLFRLEVEVVKKNKDDLGSKRKTHCNKRLYSLKLQTLAIIPWWSWMKFASILQISEGYSIYYSPKHIITKFLPNLRIWVCFLSSFSGASSTMTSKPKSSKLSARGVKLSRPERITSRTLTEETGSTGETHPTFSGGFSLVENI